MATQRNQAKSARAADGKILTWQEIIEAQDLPTDVIDVPEWGGQVKIRALTQGEAGQVIKRVSEGEGVQFELQERLMVRFGLVEPAIGDDALDTLLDKSAAVISRLSGAIDALSEDTPDIRKKSRVSFRASAGAS
ncbi:MAG TPA: hypothetical protein VEW67_03995 [Thermoleophilaceae bacterium]|nr:hypothetical protein [Thermoleophilaceae bacterium]